MSTRMQQRRGTALQWLTLDPILAAGEIGFEVDTNEFKIGDGVSLWSELSPFKNLVDLGGSLDDYIPLTQLGVANGVATLDVDGKLSADQLPSIDEISQDAINAALVAGTGIDKTYNDASNTITLDIDSTVATKTYADDAATNATTAANTHADNAVSAHSADTTNIHGIANTADLATKTYVDNATSTLQTAVDAKAPSNAPTLTNPTLQVSSGGTVLSYPGYTLATSDSIDTPNGYSGTWPAVFMGMTTDPGTFSIGQLLTLANTEHLGTNVDGIQFVVTDFFLTNIRGGEVQSYFPNSFMVVMDAVNTANDAQVLAWYSNFPQWDNSNPVTFTEGSTSTISPTEISYLDGITSNVQDQIDIKASINNTTLTGTTNVDNLEIAGSLTFSGVATQIDSTTTTLSDPMIYLGEGNANNINDLGFVASFNNGTYQHSGLVRDASDNKWKLFRGVTDEPTTTVNFTQAALDTLAVGALETSAATFTGVVNFNSATVTGIDALPTQTGNAGKYLTTDGTVATWSTVSGGTGGTVDTSNIIHPFAMIG